MQIAGAVERRVVDGRACWIDDARLLTSDDTSWTVVALTSLSTAMVRSNPAVFCITTYRVRQSYGPITIAIRARFEYDSSAIQHPTSSYVLSSNNEHVNSFALL